MNYLCKQALIWVGDYFPSIPRLLGLKILYIGYTDITPDIGCGNRPNGKIVESKVSWLVKSGWVAPIPLKIVMACIEEQDVWAQVYPVNKALQGGWDRDVSCGEEKFVAELGQKRRSTIVPPHGLLKVDHFAAMNPHPSYGSNFAFQLVPDDPSVIVRHRDFLNQKGAKWWYWGMRCVIGVTGIAITGCAAVYFWVRYCDQVWKRFFS